MEETGKLQEFKVRIRGIKINRDPFTEVFIVAAKNRREAGKLVDSIIRDPSPRGRLYKYGHFEDRVFSEIEPLQ